MTCPSCGFVSERGDKHWADCPGIEFRKEHPKVRDIAP